MSIVDDLFAESGAPALLDMQGESITFYPDAGGGARTITAIVNDDGQTLESRTHQVDEVQSIQVTVLTDAADATYGGISRLYRGDSIRRADGSDPDERKWVWNGNNPERTDTMLTATFTRIGTLQTGLAQTQQ